MAVVVKVAKQEIAVTVVVKTVAVSIQKTAVHRVKKIEKSSLQTIIFDNVI